MRTEFGWKAFR